MDWGSGALAIVRTDMSLPPETSNATISVTFLHAGHFFPVFTVSGCEIGQTVSASVSFRFGGGSDVGGGTSALLDLVGPELKRFAAAVPFTRPTLKRGPIGVAFGSNCGATCNCASYSSTDCPNPRGWSSDMVGNLKVNISSAEGVADFHAAALDWANRSVQYCLRLGCAGLIFWSIEGSEYTWDT